MVVINISLTQECIAVLPKGTTVAVAPRKERVYTLEYRPRSSYPRLLSSTLWKSKLDLGSRSDGIAVSTSGCSLCLTWQNCHSSAIS